jgi:hypothetical protein
VVSIGHYFESNLNDLRCGVEVLFRHIMEAEIHAYSIPYEDIPLYINAKIGFIMDGTDLEATGVKSSIIDKGFNNTQYWNSLLQERLSKESADVKR